MMLTSDALSGLDSIAHGFFTREGGVSEGAFQSMNCGFGSDDNPLHVTENRARAMSELGLQPEALTTVRQIHSSQVAFVPSAWAYEASPEADGMVTRTPGVALGILTADCAPVLFADASAGVVGAAHAGWKGALSGVLDATLEAMVGLGAAPENTVAAIGPCIAQDSYEVSDPFHADFLGHDSANGRFFKASNRNGHHLFDLGGFVAAQLADLCIGNVASLRVDTYTDETRFFSYRRTCHRGEKEYGRLMAVIALKGK